MGIFVGNETFQLVVEREALNVKVFDHLRAVDRLCVVVLKLTLVPLGVNLVRKFNFALNILIVLLRDCADT